MPPCLVMPAWAQARRYQRWAMPVQRLIGVAQRAEQTAARTRHLPPGARHGQGVGTERHEAILGTLALDDVDAHAVGVTVQVFHAQGAQLSNP